MRKHLLTLACFAALATPRPILATPLFMGLGGLEGGAVFQSAADGVSADGSVVVGHSQSSAGGEALRWTLGGGMVGLGDLPGGGFNSLSRGASADGSVVVGQAASAAGVEAFRWEGGVMTGLGDLPGGIFQSNAFDVSADGSVVVGHGASALATVEAFRWEGGVMTGLGDLPGGIFHSNAQAVSADGSVVVGSSVSGSANEFEAFRWTQADGMVGLGTLIAGPDSGSSAFGVSADGSVVVGASGLPSAQEAFRWTMGSGMEGLGLLPGGIMSFAKDVSDGGVIVGHTAFDSFGDDRAIIWDAQNGMRDLMDVLTDEFGLNLAFRPSNSFT